MVPSTSMFWRWLVTGPSCGVAQPEDGTAGPVATGAVVGAVAPALPVVAVVVVEQAALAPTTSIARPAMATARLWLRALLMGQAKHIERWWG